MDDTRRKALRQCHANDLRDGIIVNQLLPKLHIYAGGFLTEVERDRIKAKSTGGNVEQVDELVDVLVKKENKAFDYFCDVLEKEGYQTCSRRLKVSAGLDRSSLKAIEYPMEGGSDMSLQLSQGSQVQVQREGGTVLKRKHSRSSASSGDTSCPPEKRPIDEYMKMKMDLERQDVKSVHANGDQTIRLLYANALSRIIRLLEPHLDAVKDAADTYLQLGLHEKDKNVKPCDIQSAESVSKLLNQMSVKAKWGCTTFLQQAVDAIPANAREREVAETILSHYDLHLAIYRKATVLKDDLAKKKKSGKGKGKGKQVTATTELVPVKITSSKPLAEFTCEDCHHLQIRFLNQSVGIPAEKIKCIDAAETQSTTVTFLIPNGFTYTIMHRSTQLETVWVFLELDVIEVAISGFTFKPSVGCFLTLLRESKPFTADLLGVTEILPYQMHCLVDPGIKEPLSGRPLGPKRIAHQRKPLDVVPEDNLLDADRESVDEQTHTAPPDKAGTFLETDSSEELQHMVSEHKGKIKDLERKVANLFMDNVSLTTKLKASRVVETEQKKGIINLEERLVLALKAQEASSQEVLQLRTDKARTENTIKMLETTSSRQSVKEDDGGGSDDELKDHTLAIMSQPKEPSKRAHHHRWWLKVSAKSRDVALPPSSPLEQPVGSVEMEGEVMFRRDPESNLMKAVSGTEWMYRRGALERGRQSTEIAHRLHQFTRYHQRWLADHVQEEEESCKQWLLHQSPEVTTVRETEEYRPGRVRYRYTTGVGLPAESEGDFSPKVGGEEKDNGPNELLSRVQELEDALKTSERKRVELMQGNVALLMKLEASQKEEGRLRQGLDEIWELKLPMEATLDTQRPRIVPLRQHSLPVSFRTTSDLVHSALTRQIPTLPLSPMTGSVHSAATRHIATLLDPLDERPTLRDLNDKVVNRVANRWLSTGMELNIENSVLQTIRIRCENTKQCCREMFRHWLDREHGCGSLPRTWFSVLHAVENSCGSEVYQKLSEDIHQRPLHIGTASHK